MSNENKGGLFKSDAKHLMIVFGCMLIQAIPFGLAQNVQPLFIHYLNDNFHFGLANIGLIFTVGAVASSIISPIAGHFYSKFSTRLVMTIALIISSLGLFLNAVAEQLWVFFLANAIIQMGCVVYSGLGVPYLIGLWFDEKTKPKALGVAFCGGSIGNFFLQPIFVNLLHKLATHSVSGLHMVYFISAVSSLVVGLLVLIFLIRDKKVTNAKNNQTAAQNIEANLQGIGATAVRKLPAFWLLSLGMFFIGINISAQSMQYANFFDALKLPVAIVGAAGSTFAVACLIGNVSGGFLFSKFGVLTSSFISCVLQLIAAGSMIVLGLNPEMKFLAFCWAACYGFTVYIYMSGPAMIVQSLFGMKESSVTLGLFSIFFACGFAIGNVIFGAIADHTTYITAWSAVIVFIIIGYAILTTMIKSIEKKDYAHMNTAPIEK